jgi:hypothetical protein
MRKEIVRASVTSGETKSGGRGPGGWAEVWTFRSAAKASTHAKSTGKRIISNPLIDGLKRRVALLRTCLCHDVGAA